MATVRVSFLLGGERFHGRLNRSSVLSDVPAKATRVNRAGPGYKIIRLRRLSHTDNLARTRQYFHVGTDEGQSFPLCFQGGDAHGNFLISLRMSLRTGPAGSLRAVSSSFAAIAFRSCISVLVRWAD